MGRHEIETRARAIRRLPRTIVAAVAALGLIAVTAQPGNAEYARPGHNYIVSIATDGTQADWPQTLPTDPGRYAVYNHDISLSGRFVVFSSPATNLVGGDDNLATDVFLRDVMRSTTEIVSVTSQGLPATGLCGPKTDEVKPVAGSGHPSVSANGRFVAFGSCAGNLAPGDDKIGADGFVRDRKNGVTELISVATDGTPGRCPPLGWARCVVLSNQGISDNGRFVTFTSVMPDLVTGDTNEGADAFVHDRQSGKTERVSVSSKGDQASGGVTSLAVISGNGRFVAFRSQSSDLVSGDTNATTIPGDVFVHDRKTKKTERVNLSTDGREELLVYPLQNGSASAKVNGDSYLGISRNGRFVTFGSLWSGFVPNDNNRDYDMFVRDRKTDRTERVSVRSSGEQDGPESAVGVSISADGRFVGFAAQARLVPEDRWGWDCADQTFCLPTPDSEYDLDVYVHDRATGSVDLITRDWDGSKTHHSSKCGNDTLSPRAECHPANSMHTGLSGNGRYVIFGSPSSQVVKGDSNNEPDTFVRDRGLPLGTGGFRRQGNLRPPDDQICVVPELCIPPSAAASVRDRGSDVAPPATTAGADLYGASLAYRPDEDDIFAAIDVDRMPTLNGYGLGGLSTGGSPSILYALRFRVEGRSYEVRATSLLGGTFGLFHCPSAQAACIKQADLRGGYGTTGERVVFSLPLGEIGLRGGGELSDVQAITGLGSYHGGLTKILDSLRFRPTRS